MSRHAEGQIRRGQVITTYGPGALIDLPNHSAIVGGLETWPKTSDLEEVVEPRLARKLQIMTGVEAPKLFAPLPDANDPREGIVRLIRLDPKNLQSRTIRLQVDATRPGRRLGLV